MRGGNVNTRCGGGTREYGEWKGRVGNEEGQCLGKEQAGPRYLICICIPCCFAIIFANRKIFDFHLTSVSKGARDEQLRVEERWECKAEAHSFSRDICQLYLL